MALRFRELGGFCRLWDRLALSALCETTGQTAERSVVRGPHAGRDVTPWLIATTGTTRPLRLWPGRGRGPGTGAAHGRPAVL